MRKLFLITTMLAFSATGLWAQTGGDECVVADDIAVAGFGTYVVAMTNVGATTGADPAPSIPCAVFGQNTDDIWFSFVPDADGVIDVTTCDQTSWDTDLLLYDGSGGCGALLELACSGDAVPNPGSCQNYYSEFDAPTAVTGGNTYYLRIGNWGASGSGGAGNLTINFFYPDDDADGIPNVCDIDETLGDDCDGNGEDDSCQVDTDSDGLIDPCDDDIDGDDIPNYCDIDETLGDDCDGNGEDDSCQVDTDSDGLIDPCDDDIDGDDIPNYCDIDQSPGSDCDGNGMLDSCDLNNGAPDCNTNGIPDSCDLDCDNNGIPDDCDLSGGAADCNANGIPDSCDLDCDNNAIPDDCDLSGGAADCDGNGILDSCELDCNSNGVLDECDVTSGASPDCNGNNIPDECEYSTAADCNSNGVLDECDILIGLSQDCNTNTIPDECEIESGSAADCNSNGVPDTCDYSTATDCNSNGLIDECDILLGISEDCDENEVPDECDIAAGAADADGDGIPDVCAGQNFLRGECNGDDSITIADAIFLLGFLFNSGPAPTCQDACDINDDSGIDIGDGVYLLAYLFSAGPNPQNPFPTCGPDPTEDLLGCNNFGGCP